MTVCETAFINIYTTDYDQLFPSAANETDDEQSRRPDFRAMQLCHVKGTVCMVL